jgi:hypothetical protein
MSQCLEDIGEISPRPNCGCQICYKAREYMIAPQLMAMMHSGPDWPPYVVTSQSRVALRHAVMAYATGRIGYAEMQIKLIQVLVQQGDKLFAEQQQRHSASMVTSLTSSDKVG